VNAVGVEGGAVPVVVATGPDELELVELDVVPEAVFALFLLTSTTTTPITVPNCWVMMKMGQ
jgi:hypothetical protein